MKTELPIDPKWLEQKAASLVPESGNWTGRPAQIMDRARNSPAPQAELIIAQRASETPSRTITIVTPKEQARILHFTGDNWDQLNW